MSPRARLIIPLAMILLLPAACADDERILFAAQLADAASRELYSVAPDGSDLTRITATDDADEFAPSWSPDKRRVAYLVDARMFVRTVDRDDAQIVAPEVGRGARGLNAPAWSPDGGQLIYCYPREPYWVDFGDGDMVDESYATTLHRVNVDGSGDVDLDYYDRTLTFPAWSIDDKVAFLTSDDCPDCPGGWDQLGLVDADGSGFEQGYFSTDDTDVLVREDLDWHPDAQRIVFTGAGIVVANAFGTTRNLLRSTGWMPRWSPDGGQIAYLDEDGIHVMGADGEDDQLVFAAEGEEAVVGIDW